MSTGNNTNPPARPPPIDRLRGGSRVNLVLSIVDVAPSAPDDASRQKAIAAGLIEKHRCLGLMIRSWVSTFTNAVGHLRAATRLQYRSGVDTSSVSPHVFSTDWSIDDQTVRNALTQRLAGWRKSSQRPRCSSSRVHSGRIFILDFSSLTLLTVTPKMPPFVVNRLG